MSTTSQVMSPSEHTADVTARDFERQVIERSRDLPVLVDFWAAWCGPCQMLMPLLARLADEYGGSFFLAKVNSDQEQALAARYGVRSLPTVKLFRNGEVVDEFMGVQPEPVIRALLDRHIPRESDALIAAAETALAAGRGEEAAELFERARDIDPGNTRVTLARVRWLTALGDVDGAAAEIESLPIDVRQGEPAKALAARLGFARLARGAPARDRLESRIAAEPADCAAREQLAACLVLDAAYEAAMEHLLEIVRRDRAYGDDAGRRHLITLFELLGPGDERVRRYRGKLAGALN